MISLTDQLNNIQNFSELTTVLEKTKLHVTHRRGRIIKTDGTSSHAQVVDLISTLYRLLKNSKNPNDERVEIMRCAKLIDLLYSKGEHIKMEAADFRFKYICYLIPVLVDTSFKDDHILGSWELGIRLAIKEGNFERAQARL